VIIRVCLAAALLTPVAATAQGNPGPYGKLFGRAPAANANGERTVVDVRSSIGGSYENALLAPEGSPFDTPLQRGMTSGITGVIAVDHSSPVFTAAASGGGTRGEYFTEPSPYGVNQFFADARATATISTRFQAAAAAGYTHSPSYSLFNDFGAAGAGVDTPLLPFSPYAVQMLENESVNGTASLTAKITEKSNVNAAVTRRQTHFAQQPDDDVAMNGYSVTWQTQLRRDFGVHAGYVQDHVDLRAPDRIDYDHQSIDIGVDYSRAFSIARRTTLQFGTSTSVIKYDGADGRFRVNGNVTLSKFFRRTWQASAQYNRETSFVPGFSEPLFSDTAGASLSGMFTKRLQWSATVSGNRGNRFFADWRFRDSRGHHCAELRGHQAHQHVRPILNVLV